MRRYLTAALASALVLGLSGETLADTPPPAGGSLPLDLSLIVNTECISIGNANLVDSSCAGDPTSSYVESTLPASGSTFTLANTKFRWTTSGLGTPDTVQAATQQLTVPKGAKGYKGIALLCSHHSDGDLTARLTVGYTDGSKSELPIVAHDWKHAQDQSAIPDVRVQYLADTASAVIFNNEGSLSLAVAALDPKKTVKYVRLPGAASLLVFAVSLAPISKAPAKIDYVR